MEWPLSQLLWFKFSAVVENLIPHVRQMVFAYVLVHKLISLLKNIKADGGMKDELYRRLYPTGAGSPKFYGLPKIHKPGIPLRPIISSIGTVTYNTAKELARILKPLVGLSKHHIHNTIDFVEQIKEVKLKKEENMVSYDVTALFTSVPIPPVLKIIEDKLEEDKELPRRTNMNTRHIIKLLEFCLRSTYFVFQGQHFEQVEGAAMGSPLSPIVANIYMEHFEARALETAPHPQAFGRGMWMTLLSSWKQLTKKSSSSIWMALKRRSNLQLTTPELMGHYPF